MSVLIPDGNSHRSLARDSRTAKDEEGNKVFVDISHEAINDFGPRACWSAAEIKYYSGNYEVKSGHRHVDIMTTDVQKYITNR